MKPTPELLRSITEKIVAECSPVMIIVFGSAADDSAKEIGDIDILVVDGAPAREGERAMEIERLFADRDFPLDLVVCTPRDLEDFKDLPGSFIHHVVHSGRVLYDRAA